MMFDLSRSDLTLGIVGAGIMGRGIAQVAAEAGVRVVLADARPEAVAEALTFCADMIRRKAEKGTISEDEAAKAVGLIRKGELYQDLAACHVVVEAVAERLDIKHEVIAGLEGAVSETCIIASNTSSLSIAGIAAKARLPERIAGLHFFNPVPLMRLVEVIGGARTEEAVLTALTVLVHRIGHKPVRALDTPGFLVNHAGRAFGTEALRIVSEGIADFADVDRVMTEAAGFRLGPFELLDLTGLDVSHPVMESIYHQYYEEPRHRPVVTTAQRLAAGLLGRKAGQGFYRYVNGKAEKAPEPKPPPADFSRPVWISSRFPTEASALRLRLEKAGAKIETGIKPSPDAVAILTPLGTDATTSALAENLDPTRCVAIDCLFDLDRRRTLMHTPATAPDVLEATHGLLAADGTAVTVIHDSPGFIAQRIIASMVNVAAEIAQQRIASPEDINVSTEMGLGYPRGSLRFGDELGPARILAVLDACHAFYGDPRYRASPWLRRRAMLGLPLTAPERRT
ncbi:3-hydroxyacyl-CoA dehydrogenase [Microvirga puerhi]|uniref:3-hydroxyacyl-CoA dehydrogenase n=1 Tax=Microvirga puerhi TaxID=2876078 RepID=A0ABS7VHU5_9HYPH|nr:3-hydroxyacyl-CoA dehydrogenase [Microvirga puerhi]MBZ6075078.1 3-hydroxyacyl-CoA dehydrogenase [Microvirga puerhi]